LLEYQRTSAPLAETPQPESPPEREVWPKDTIAAREGRWDVYTTAEAPDIAGNGVAFATLPNGDIIIDVEQGDADLSPLAEAVEKHLKPPYRATGRLEAGAIWAVAARQIDVRRLPPCNGDSFDVIVRDGQPDLIGLDPEGEYAVHAERLDGDFWEIEVGVL